MSLVDLCASSLVSLQLDFFGRQAYLELAIPFHSNFCFFLSVCKLVCQSVCQFVVSLFGFWLVDKFICLFICLFVCLFVCRFLCMHVFFCFVLRRKERSNKIVMRGDVERRSHKLLLFTLGKVVSLLFPLSTQQYLKWVRDVKTAKELLVA